MCGTNQTIFALSLVIADNEAPIAMYGKKVRMIGNSYKPIYFGQSLDRGSADQGFMTEYRYLWCMPNNKM